MNDVLLTITGEVEIALALTSADLAAIAPEQQIADVSLLAPGRQGCAVKLAAVLALARPKDSAKYLGLHASADNFHASIPLAAVIERGLVIYRLNGQPLTGKSGGPVRFFIPDHATCQTDEVDECANVKFVDAIELTATRGFDNRPHDAQEHAALHEQERH